MLAADARLLQARASPGSNLVLKLNCRTSQAVVSSFLWRTLTFETADTWIICRSSMQQMLTMSTLLCSKWRCRMLCVSCTAYLVPCKHSLKIRYTVETPYSMIPYTTKFDITRWTHGPQNLQRPIRTLIVLLGFLIEQIFVEFVCLLPVPSTLNEPTWGPLPVTTMTAGPITSDFNTLRPFPLESIIISGAFTKE